MSGTAGLAAGKQYFAKCQPPAFQRRCGTTPWRPNARSAAQPIPLQEPVTRATRPANRSGSFRKIVLACNFTSMLIIQLLVEVGFNVMVTPMSENDL
jgi:hypothetical protein